MSGEVYSGITDLGIYEKDKYVAGVPVYAEGAAGERQIRGMVLAITETQTLTEMWRAFLGIFGMTSITVILIAFVASSVTAMQQTKPIKEMAAATRRFAEGNFDARVQITGRDYVCIMTRGHQFDYYVQGQEWLVESARRFAEGNFDARVQSTGRDDEVEELAEAFNAMADSLQQTERQRREFIANISHELKTPMTTITGYAEGILDGTIPREKEEQYLRIISDESRRLSRLVRRMLEVSRLQSLDALRSKSSFDICESMRRVLISMEKKITDRQLDVEADIPEEPVLVLGDNDLITQVIYNLLENAAKFARTGTALVLRLDVGAEKAVVTVQNQGNTIDPEEIPRLFERFHKADKSRSQDKDGVGLGLYIVKTILDQHREHIQVTSENGVTSFRFTMTLAAGDKNQH